MNVNQQDFNLGNNQLALNPDLVSTVVVNSFLQSSTNLAFYKFPVYPHTYCFTKKSDRIMQKEYWLYQIDLTNRCTSSSLK